MDRERSSGVEVELSELSYGNGSEAARSDMTVADDGAAQPLLAPQTSLPNHQQPNSHNHHRPAISCETGTSELLKAKRSSNCFVSS